MGYQLDDFLGNSTEIAWIRKQLPQLAQSRIPILIYGDTGTGKTLLAEIVHYLSTRRNGPYVHLDCGAMVEDLVANELFGHVRGSFTSADRTQCGLIEQAHTGTLFLDELGNLSYEAQTKLLQVLDEGRFRRVGGVEEIGVDVRIIGASTRDLRYYVDEGRLRKDLYYRLKGIRLALPHLRDRRDDILMLFNHFLSKYSHQLNRKMPRVTHEAREILVNYPWPGNVRELMRLAEEIASLHQVEHVTPNDLRFLDLDAIRCWDILHCDRKECPAFSNHDHRCWLADDTVCHDGIPRKVAQKIHFCLDCDVFLRNCFIVEPKDPGRQAEFLRGQVRAWSLLANQKSSQRAIVRPEDFSFKQYRNRVIHCSSREYFTALLKKYRGDVDQVVKHSGLSKSTIYQILRNHQLTVEEFRLEPKAPSFS